jgi:HEAT repeat protein
MVLARTGQCWAAIVALAHSPDPHALQYLGDLASFSDPLVRRYVVQWIGRCPDGAKLAGVVVERLRDPHGSVVRTAAHVAGELAISEAHAGVVALLGDTAPATREAGLWALEKLWQEADFELVLKVFESDASQKVRRTAGWTLRGTRTASTAAVLVELWRADPLARHRVWACEIVAEFQQRQFYECLTHLTGDRDGHVRKAAKRALQALAP